MGNRYANQTWHFVWCSSVAWKNCWLSFFDKSLEADWYVISSYKKLENEKKSIKPKNRGNAEHCCGVIACIAASKKEKYISDDLCNAKQIALNFSILFYKH